MKANKEVSPMKRAEEIWKWWVLWNEERGREVDPEQMPDPTLVADAFGIHRSTAAKWLEPLRKEWAGTQLDPRFSLVQGGDDE